MKPQQIIKLEKEYFSANESRKKDIINLLKDYYYPFLAKKIKKQ